MIIDYKAMDVHTHRSYKRRDCWGWAYFIYDI